MPVEIRQLMIKSKTISDDSKNEYADSDSPDVDADQKQSERTLSYYRIGSLDEIRER